MKGWLLDTHVVAALINPNGAPSVKTWAAAQDEASFYLSVLTLGEYDKGIHNLRDDHVDRPRYMATRDALAERFEARVLSISDDIVRRWGRISGEVKRATDGEQSTVVSVAQACPTAKVLDAPLESCLALTAIVGSDLAVEIEIASHILRGPRAVDDQAQAGREFGLSRTRIRGGPGRPAAHAISKRKGLCCKCHKP